MEFIVLFLAIIVLVIIFSRIRKSVPLSIEAPYELIGPLFTPAERSFYGVLSIACGDQALVFGKVRVADILKPKKGLDRSLWQTVFNKISAKHFDFVVCHPSDLSVLAVVELDDNSHLQKKRIKRDEFIELACLNAGLKLHRFKASVSYNIDDIKSHIFSSTTQTELVIEVSEQTTDIKKCPKCTSELIVRTAQKGQNKGNVFLACSSFPTCRYTE
jgi:predicted RNA-binding Zn-ribbon protein involved in translation (DUF1610 family)